MLKNGFYTALGTPLTEDGKIVEGSLVKHIDQQIGEDAFADAILGVAVACHGHTGFGGDVGTAKTHPEAARRQSGSGGVGNIRIGVVGTAGGTFAAGCQR